MAHKLERTRHLGGSHHRHTSDVGALVFKRHDRRGMAQDQTPTAPRDTRLVARDGRSYAASAMVERMPATVVRCMSRGWLASNGRERCMVAWLSQITRSNCFH